MRTTGDRSIKRRVEYRGFTLVELLVVITIIGILAALILVAGAGALKTARQTEIKVELDQLSMAFETYRDTNGSYPPNAQTDFAASTPVLDGNQALADLKRHLKQAFPKHRESDSLLQLLLGQTVAGGKELPGGMTAGEAIGFWLGGFSADPRYPISGDGGPSYALPTLSGDATQDPIQDRNFVYPFDVARFGPRDATTNYFDSNSTRFIEYTVTINGVQQTRRINFWQYVPKKSTQPYLYFNTSQHPAEARFDPPAATEPTQLGPNGEGLHVHAIKKVSESASSAVPIEFANPDKFQILHCGVDDEWGEEAFERMSAHGVVEAGYDPALPESYLPYPIGPFTGEIADTIVNFSPSTLEKSQP